MFNTIDIQDIDNIRNGLDFSEVEYPLMEDFYTIQGEGAHTGRPSYFIRTAGCAVNCWWCDVQESWNEEAHPRETVANIESRAKASSPESAVITSREAPLHDLEPQTYVIKQSGKRTHTETSR